MPTYTVDGLFESASVVFILFMVGTMGWAFASAKFYLIRTAIVALYAMWIYRFCPRHCMGGTSVEWALLFCFFHLLSVLRIFIYTDRRFPRRIKSEQA